MTSGRLKSEGRPTGATCVSMHAVVRFPLIDGAGDMQMEDATLAGVFTMGGGVVTIYVPILERRR